MAAHCAQAQAFDQAQTRADTDLREAVETLSQVRQQIEKEKLPLSTKIATLDHAERVGVRAGLARDYFIPVGASQGGWSGSG
ncbi:MAG: hypothetical protein VXV86_05885, partial [Verrucomicrobiota bacterium]|nr:hypothetical protein [Verrucomicrobiota bacterium]